MGCRHAAGLIAAVGLGQAQLLWLLAVALAVLIVARVLA
jgi:hypothetical protein